MDSMDHQDLAQTVQRIANDVLPAMQADVRRIDTEALPSMQAKIERLDDAVRRIARGVVVLQSDLSEVKERMATKADMHRILEAIDAFSGMARSFNDSKTIHGRSLTDAEVKLKDHERRIKGLEDRLQ
jgi:hypothetical protein